jgi:HSP20 family protein
MFGDDFFDRIEREFLGSGFSRAQGSDSFMKGEEEERNIDFIQTNDYVYVIFELPGYKKEEVEVNVKGGELFVTAQARPTESNGEYLSQKLANGESITKFLPKFVVSKGFKTTFRNGILEICFKKK